MENFRHIDIISEKWKINKLNLTNKINSVNYNIMQIRIVAENVTEREDGS